MTNDQTNTIEGRVLERVRGGGVHMKSRWHFLLRLVATIAAALLALALSSIVLSFIVFSIQEGGEQLLLGFGARGIETFFLLFPWLSFVFDLVVIVLLEWLLQGFSIGYRFSLLSVFAAVFAASAMLAFFVCLTPLNPTLLDAADHGELPLLGGVYEQIHDTHEAQGVFRGTVVATGTDEIVIAHDDHDLDSDDATHTIKLPPGTASQFKPGDRVYVLGTPRGDVVEASGVGAR